MSQVLRVVCCFQCRQFQSDIVKKSNKWTCNRCNTKQTLRKEYGRGSGRECRLLAQQLSTKTCESEDLLDQSLIEALLQQDDNFEIPPDDEKQVEQIAVAEQGGGTSKWVSFLANEDPEEDTLGLLSGNPLPQLNTFYKPQAPAREESRLSNSIPEPSMSHQNWQPKRNDHVDPPTKKSQSIPLMNFHQMGKQDKKQFKWESRKTNPPKMCPISTKEETIASEKPPTQGVFSFKPKAPTSLKRPPERVEEMFAMKRELVEEYESSASNEVEFNKILKLDSENSEIGAHKQYSGIDTSLPTSSGFGAGSKWGKFVVKHEEDDGIIKT